MYFMYKKIGILSLGILFLISLFFSYQASQIRSDYSLSDFFPKGDTDTEYFQSYKKKFDLKDDALLIAYEPEGGIFQQSFLQRLQALSDSLEALPLISAVQSPTNLSFQVLDPLFSRFYAEPYLHPDQAETYYSDSIRIFQSSQLIGSFFSEDRKGVCMYLKHSADLGKVQSQTLLTQVKKQVHAHGFSDARMAGSILAQDFFLNLIREEMILFISISLLLLILFLWLAFRTVWGVWVPLLVVILSLVWLLGIMELREVKLGLLTNILPSIVLVVGLSASVHILSRYREELKKGADKLPAIFIALKEVGTANLLKTLTTSIGILTILPCSVQPIQELGVYTAMGVGLALVLSYTLLPAIMVLSAPPDISKSKQISLLGQPQLSRLFDWMMSHQKFIATLAVGGLSMGLFGISQMEVNNYLIEEVKGDHRFERDLAFFEDSYAGARLFEMSVSVRDTNQRYWEAPVLPQIQKLEEHLTSTYGVRNLLSPLAFLKLSNQAYGGGNPEAFQLPENKESTKKQMARLQKYKSKIQLDKWQSDEGREIRLSGRMADLGSNNIIALNQGLKQFVKDNCPDLDYTLTGTPMLIDKNNRLMATSMVEGLLIAFGIVSLLVGLMFRSVRMVGIALVSNCIPLILVGGLMGFLGIDLKLSTSIIFTIAFGIAVDDTLHFLSRLKEEFHKGNGLVQAIRTSFITSGRAIILTSLILMGGFITLGLSSVYGTFYLGVLVCLTLLLAVLADLFLLPVLLLWFYPEPIKKTESFQHVSAIQTRIPA